MHKFRSLSVLSYLKAICVDCVIQDAIRQENGREFMGTRIVVEWSRGYKDKNGGRGVSVFVCTCLSCA